MAEEIVKIIIGLLVCVGYAASHCPNSWVFFEGQCYFFAHDPKTFTDAEHFCLQRGAHLAHVYSNLENLFLKNMCKDLVHSTFWIGLTDVEIDGVWRWKHTNKVVNFTDWYAEQPAGGNSENCVVLWQNYGYQWGDITCSFASAMPICQKPLPASCDEKEVGIVG